MEGQEYLNQLAASARPVKPKKSGLFSSKLFIWLMAALAALIVIIIIGSIIGGNKGGEQKLSIALKMHIDSTADIIQTYQTNVKSSDLRSNSASLYSVLSNTSRELGEFLTEKYSLKEKDYEKKLDKETVSKLAETSEDLDSELFEAKINGILDRIYAHKMAYEISVLIAEETKLMDTTKNETLDEWLSTSCDSLNNLYDKFNDFSETKTTRKE